VKVIEFFESRREAEFEKTPLFRAKYFAQESSELIKTRRVGR
jgi:hypothetical protein